MAAVKRRRQNGPPEHLSDESQRIWADVAERFSAAGRAMLTFALESKERADCLRVSIDAANASGESVEALIATECRYRSHVLDCWKSLGLTS